VDEVVFGRYRLLSLLGDSAMGKVYKAHDTLMGRDVTLMGRDVAVNVLPPELAAEPAYEERFRRESRQSISSDCGCDDRRHALRYLAVR
jgi:serine/threonine-protein kinase